MSDGKTVYKRGSWWVGPGEGEFWFAGSSRLDLSGRAAEILTALAKDTGFELSQFEDGNILEDALKQQLAKRAPYIKVEDYENYLTELKKPQASESYTKTSTVMIGRSATRAEIAAYDAGQPPPQTTSTKSTTTPLNENRNTSGLSKPALPPELDEKKAKTKLKVDKKGRVENGKWLFIPGKLKEMDVVAYSGGFSVPPQEPGRELIVKCIKGEVLNFDEQQRCLDTFRRLRTSMPFSLLKESQFREAVSIAPPMVQVSLFDDTAATALGGDKKDHPLPTPPPEEKPRVNVARIDWAYDAKGGDFIYKDTVFIDEEDLEHDELLREILSLPPGRDLAREKDKDSLALAKEIAQQFKDQNQLRLLMPALKIFPTRILEAFTSDLKTTLTRAAKPPTEPEPPPLTDAMKAALRAAQDAAARADAAAEVAGEIADEAAQKAGEATAAKDIAAGHAEDANAAAEKLKEEMARAASQSMDTDLPDGIIRVGPFVYNKETDDIFFEEQEGSKIDTTLINLPPKQKEMFVTLIKAEGKVRTDPAWSVTVRSLPKTLEKIQTGLSKHLFTDGCGYRLLPFKGPPTPDSIPEKNAIKVGKWLLDNRTDLIFYDGKLQNFKPKTHIIYVAAIKAFPSPINLPEDYDLSENNRLFRKRNDCDNPIYYSHATKRVVLNIPFAEISDEQKTQMQITTYGPVTFCHLQGRVWINGIGISGDEKVGMRELDGLKQLIESEGHFTNSKRMTEVVYGRYEEVLFHQTSVVMGRIKNFLSKHLPEGAGLYSKHGAGYGLFASETDFDEACLALLPEDSFGVEEKIVPTGAFGS